MGRFDCVVNQDISDQNGCSTPDGARQLPINFDVDCKYSSMTPCSVRSKGSVTSVPKLMFCPVGAKPEG
jgi:hypothetical protein